MPSTTRLALLAALALSLPLAGCLWTPTETVTSKGPDATPTDTSVPGMGSSKPRIVLAMQTSNPQGVSANAEELERFLEARTGADVDVFMPTDHAGVVYALRFGHAQAAFLGAWPARLAHDIGGAEIVLAENREVVIDGEKTVAPYYYSYYVVLKESPYETLDDLQGKKAAYTSFTSTSGYLYPVAKLVQTGRVPAPPAGKEADPAAFFGSVAMAGDYAKAWNALKNGQVDVAVTAGDIKVSLFDEVMNATRVVETQGPIPSHAVVFSKDFNGTPEAEKLKAALLELKGEHKDLMRKLVSGIYVEFVETTTEKHTAPLRSALDATGFRMQDKLG